MYDSKETGMRIRNLRKQRGMTQSDLAQILNIADKSVISKIENGVKELSIDYAVMIAEYFNVSLNYLLRGERFMNNDFISMFQQVPDEYRDVAEKMIIAALSSITK